MLFVAFNRLLLAATALVPYFSMTLALGSTCSTPLGGGTAGVNDPFWMQNIKHQGLAAFNSNPTGYQVFRNVKDFGAKGDGVTDDTAAIKYAQTRVCQISINVSMKCCYLLRKPMWKRQLRLNNVCGSK